jgi:hypothetical protein
MHRQILDVSIPKMIQDSFCWLRWAATKKGTVGSVPESLNRDGEAQCLLLWPSLHM